MSRKLPDPEIPFARPREHRYLMLGIAAVLLIVAGFASVAFYHSAKIWRAHWLVRQALASGEPVADAESKLVAAYHLAPDDLQVLRACARWQMQAGDVHALGFYRLILSHENFTRKDQRDALRACLFFGNLSGARELASVLTVEAPEAEDYALEAQVFWKEGSLDSAIGIMRNALIMAPEDRSHQFLLDQMLISGTDPRAQDEAIQSLKKLAEGKDEVGLKALVILSNLTQLDPATQRWVLDQLRQYPLVEDQGRLAAWKLEERLGLRDSITIGNEVIAFFRNTDLARKSTAARWLYIQNQPELALRLASPPDTLANQNLLLVRLDSLAYLKRWADLKTELANSQIPLSQPMIFLYRARADRELGDAAGSHANWDRARTAAKLDYPALSSLVNYAMKLGIYDEAKLTLTQMTQIPERGREAFAALLQVEAQHGTTAEVVETLDQMRKVYPQLPEPQNDWAYLNLLLNTNVTEAAKIAQDLVTAHPDLLAYRSTLALAHLRQNDATAAAKVYDGLNIDWATAPNSWEMIYAVVLAANGKQAQAQEMARKVDRSQLRPEELELVKTYFPGT